ncbi:MAG: hypothetical protein HY908_01615 [Myxococcales bacterium]|nr:hypothetical protein [Myxococcales bacterium]
MPPRPERAWSARHAAPIHGAMHFVVDATSVGTTMAAVGLHGLTLEDAYLLVLAYDLLAFAPQFAIGLVTDRLRAPRPVLQAGLVLTALGAGLLPFGPVVAMVLVGLGNALFHVGASVFALSVAPHRAAPAGVFVAPGALGLGLGMWLGNRGAFEPWPFVAALGVCLGVATVVQSPELPYAAAGTGTAPHTGSGPTPHVGPTEPTHAAAWLVFSLLCLSIAVRAFVGMGGAYACPKGSLVALGLPLAAFGGKALGGWLADRLGWVETGVGALVVSAPLIAFGGAHTEVVLAGLFFFQMTMPVTLAAAVRVTPARPGFAFGLTCLALVSGSIPSFLDETRTLYGPPLFLGLVLASAAALYAALRLLGGRVPVRQRAGATRASVTQSA